jgi:predicted anti-sigma-YlaC factor YlaD
MNRIECPFEHETLALVHAGRWPASCDETSRAHIEACSACRDLVQVASLVAADYQASIRRAHVPNSGLVWWRMQRRMRQDAVRTASRVITIVQAIAVAAGVAVAIGILVAMGRSFGFGPAEMSRTVLAQWGVPLLIAFASWLALAPVALYLAVSKD